MFETLILNIIGALVAIGISVGILIIYSTKKSKQLENNEQKDPFSEIISSFSESMTQIIQNELKSEELQQTIQMSIMTGISTLISQKENQEAIRDYASNLITAAINEIIPQFTGAPPITEEEFKKIDGKTDKALGALTVNAAEEILPTGAGYILDKIFPQWKNEAQNNPKEFMFLMQKAKEYGVFNMIPGYNPQQQSTPIRNTPRQSGF